MKKKLQKMPWISAVFAMMLLVLTLCLLLYRSQAQKNTRYSSATYAMSTVVSQRVYGAHAEAAMQQVEQALRTFENTLSLYHTDSEIARINAAAGKEAVPISESTRALLAQGKALSLASDNAFALTIAPITLAWGVTSDAPRVPPQSELDLLLPLVNDEDLILEGQTAMLRQTGQAIDLGGIAKGTACNLAKQIYEDNGVESALLDIGGNIYVKGVKPDGTLYRIGFRDPARDATAYIASFVLQDAVFATSGGYERFFEEDGVRYLHIFDPATGAPAQSDIVSVGVLDADGTTADFMSTTLFVQGKEKALAYMRSGGIAIVLDHENNLYVSQALQASFEMNETGYQVIFI